jgi:hypothetical protein
VSNESPIPSPNRDSLITPRRVKIFLGVMAVLVFVSVYSHFTGTAPTASAHRETSSGLGWVSPLCLVLGAVTYLWGQRAHRQSQDLVPGLTALRERRLGDARRLLAQARESYGRTVLLGPQVHLHEGLAHLQSGDLDRAESSLVLADRRGWLGIHQDARLQAAVALAQVLALAGRSEASRTWLAEAKQRRDKLAAPLTHRSELLVAEMMVLVREGNFGAAIALHDASAAELAHTEPAHRLRVWWALVAYATWHMGEARNHAAAEPLLRKLRTSEPHDLAHLVVRWSELRAFLETHGVAANALARLDATGAA